MSLSPRSVLLGIEQSRDHRYLVVILTFGTFATTFAAYTLGLFSVSGGVVWLPVSAAVVGMIAGFWIGFSRSGLLFAWIVMFTALLGYHADRAFFGLSGQGFTEQFSYFVRPDALVFFAVEGVILGTLAFVLGALLRQVINPFQRGMTSRFAKKGD